MDFKKKAGLALALAAIFTTGGAGVALADNITGMSSTGPGTASIGSGAVTGDTVDTSVIKPNADGDLTITGSSTVLTTGEGKSLSFTGGDVVKELTLTDVVLDIAGDGGALISSNNGVVPTVITDKAVTIGKADDVNSGGTLNTLNMGSADSDLTLVGGSLVISTLVMHDSSDLLVDPAWAPNGGYNPGRKAIGHVGVGTDSTIANNVKVARNSQLTFGLRDVDWLSGIVQETGHSYYDKIGEGMKWSSDQGATGYTAALGIFSPQIVDETTGGITVDGSTDAPTTAAGTIEFKDQSLFVVNADGLNGAAAISGLGGDNELTLKIGSTLASDKGTGMYLFNAANGGSYKLVSNLVANGIVVGNETVTLDNAYNLSDANEEFGDGWLDR